MLRRSPSRNQRSKGFKLNSVLQICVLVAVCVWLLSQARHLQDNMSIKGLPEKVGGNGHEIVKLGRKDLLPQAKERLLDDQILHREEEEEAGSRAGGNVEEARGGEDVRDQDRLEEDEEVDDNAAEEDSEQEEDFADEDDKDREEESEREEDG